MFLKSNKLKLFFVSTFLLISTSVFSSEKNITYMQILQNPNDLDLNIKYAQQQGKMGNFKQTISTLERLNMLYPDNVEIKLYLLSVLVQVDSPEKANTIIEEMKLRKDLEPEDLVLIGNKIASLQARVAGEEFKLLKEWSQVISDNNFSLISMSEISLE